MTDVFSPAPSPTYRLIPSRFPPIGLFDTVATAADAYAVMELAGWTSDRLVDERLRRLPENEWVYGRPNASVIMASFLHVPLAGSRFNGPELGAWYAAAELRTAAFEVAHHLRREAVTRTAAHLERDFRTYKAHLAGSYFDIRSKQTILPEVYESGSYAASQVMGQTIRASGGSGIVYDSVRHLGGVNVAAYHPRSIEDVIVTDCQRRRKNVPDGGAIVYQSG